MIIAAVRKKSRPVLQLCPPLTAERVIYHLHVPADLSQFLSNRRQSGRQSRSARFGAEKSLGPAEERTAIVQQTIHPTA